MGRRKLVGKPVSNEGVEEKRQAGLGSRTCPLCTVHVRDTLIG